MPKTQHVRVISFHFKEIKYKTLYIVVSYLLTASTCLFKVKELYFLTFKALWELKRVLMFTELYTGFITEVLLISWFSLILILPMALYVIGMFVLKGFKTSKGLFLLSNSFILTCSCLIVTLFFYKKGVSYLLPIFFFFEETEAPFERFITLRADTYFSFLLYFIKTLVILHFVLFIFSNSLFNRKARTWLYSTLSITLLLVAPPDFYSQTVVLLLLGCFLELYIHVMACNKRFWRE